jgi:hypothetical protein
MTMFQAAGMLSQSQLVNTCIGTLVSLRKALNACNDLHLNLSSVTAADLVALPGGSLTTADANTIMAALADAAALDGYYNTGTPPGSYPQPASAYVYGASQREVIGPVTDT